MTFKEAIEDLLKGTSQSVVQQAIQAVEKREKVFLNLIKNPTLPLKGFDDATIEFIIDKLAAMDANNNPDICGVGEREGRIYAALVKKRHYNLSHGIGRSGNLVEIQPKAPGSAMLQVITNRLLKQTIKVAGLRLDEMVVLLAPVATGMGLALVLKTLALKRPDSKYVLMPRIDQKSCIKCVAFAGLKLVVIENKLVGDKVCTDMNALQMAIDHLGAEMITAVITTSSCFAPRVCDDLIRVGELCKAKGIPQVVNNAYGLQSTTAVNKLNEAIRRELVVAIVQSCDKNFMVPVGGSIIIADPPFTEEVANIYPGRASITPVLDLFITLLSMGVKGYQTLLNERKDCFKYFGEQLKRLEEISNTRHPVKVLQTESNDISIAIKIDPEISSLLGSKLFHRSISGARLIMPTGERKVEGVNLLNFDANLLSFGANLSNFGAHHPSYPHVYLTVAASLGMTRSEVDTFLTRITALLK